MDDDFDYGDEVVSATSPVKSQLSSKCHLTMCIRLVTTNYLAARSKLPFFKPDIWALAASANLAPLV